MKVLILIRMIFSLLVGLMNFLRIGKLSLRLLIKVLLVEKNIIFKLLSFVGVRFYFIL